VVELLLGMMKVLNLKFSTSKKKKKKEKTPVYVEFMFWKGDNHFSCFHRIFCVCKTMWCVMAFLPSFSDYYVHKNRKYALYLYDAIPSR
jgi:hypothetical protein